ncbi:histone-like nucleoid-structuring protein Lsr2 [Streptomyces sp. NPDC059783]|uniref:Lsr2 family DNA-binding protein n=1 Tax=Streptomyces sp. NPDC059783 TaxID=3346944 RepID=UPI00364A4404
MTISALRALLDEELPDVPRHPAPQIPHTARNPHTARKRKRMNQQPAVPGPRPAQDTTPSYDDPPLSTGALLAWAIAHSTKGIARKGVQARELLAELRTLRADAERIAQADAEEKRLLEALAAVRARKEQLRPRRKTTAPGTATATQAAVRAWARSKGLPVAERGSIPASVVEAWKAAQGGAR